MATKTTMTENNQTRADIGYDPDEHFCDAEINYNDEIQDQLTDDWDGTVTIDGVCKQCNRELTIVFDLTMTQTIDKETGVTLHHYEP